MTVHIVPIYVGGTENLKEEISGLEDTEKTNGLRKNVTEKSILNVRKL